MTKKFNFPLEHRKIGSKPEVLCYYLLAITVPSQCATEPYQESLHHP